MKTIAFVLLVLISSCDQMYKSEKAKDPDVVVCAVNDPHSLVDYGLSYYMSASIDRSSLDQQLKITMNDDVMLDTCAATSVEGFGVYPDYGGFYLYFNFASNDTWRASYVGTDGVPVRSDLDLKIETRARCQDAWREAVPETTTAVSWQVSGGCAPPGYYGTFSVPLGN